MLAPAKINLYLGVGAQRPDGYHDVETVLHTVSLADTIILEPAQGIDLASEMDLGIPPADNLAVRAAVELAGHLGREPDVKITLVKQIPAGAGFGGASSDAAAVLAGLPLLWDMSVDDLLLSQVAAGLGADVPFFLAGATALYGERGDVCIREVRAPVLNIALVKCAGSVPTPLAYTTFDRLGGPTPPGPAAVISACESGDETRVADALFNNMNAAAIDIVPEIATVLELCETDPGVLGCTLSGSGTAVFAVCESAAATERLVGRAGERGYWARATRSDGAGVRSVGEGSP